MAVFFIRSDPADDILKIMFAFLLTWFSIWALCDIIIATVMVVLLIRSDTRHQSTRRMVKRVIRLTVETGVITAGGSITSLVLLAAFPDQTYVVGISMSLEKWCSITLLVQLNSRARQYDYDVDDSVSAPTQIESALFQDTWVSGQTLSRRPSELRKRMNDELKSESRREAVPQDQSFGGVR
ncbi:hypothetical protein F5887DRAFT_1068305 [Amanita rubescens]|nr:hypothetical protein F5887DRAFT_1068305 [Amanita rubescens]